MGRFFPQTVRIYNMYFIKSTIKDYGIELLYFITFGRTTPSSDAFIVRRDIPN